MKTIPKKITITSPVVALLAAAALLLSGGCVAEDLTGGECPPEPEFRLTFHYTFNASGHDTIAEDVHSIDIYIFDATTGVLIATAEVDSNDIARGWVEIDGLPDGEYTFVAWGASDDDLGDSFTARHMVDPRRGDHSPVEVGVTTLDDFYMMLGCESARGSRGETALSEVDFDDLFHATACNVTLTRTEGAKVDFDFIRNTGILSVTVTGLEHLADTTATTRAATPPTLFAVGNNGRHRWDNSIDPWAGQVRYPPRNVALSPGTMSGDIHIMRLDKARHTGPDGDPVLLCLQDTAGEDILPPLDIMAAIDQIRSPDGRQLYASQEAIDRQEEFRIAIAIEPAVIEPPEPPEPPADDKIDISITVTINDWPVVILDPIVEPWE